jgi:eukaryotic-like serine/threonine-protein kinase
MIASASHEILGHYTIYEQLGRGGMATVNRAEMRGLAGFRKLVALKRLHPHVAKDPSMIQLLVHEARLASHLYHPNIAQTYDLGKVGDTYFIAMEYIPGPTLNQLLRQTAAAAGSVPIPIALSILGQICDALDYAHELCDEDGEPFGIIHRDVSPSNIIVSSTGVVKLIDFGVAKVAGLDNAEAGLIKGKLPYMAPEYLQGQLDLRADLFGLGVIAHELLTGRPLFHAGNDHDMIRRLREMPIEPPSRWNPAVPGDLDDIVLTALQRTPELRWQSAAAMRTAIRNVLLSSWTPVTNHQLLEWAEWAFQRAPAKEEQDLACVRGALDEPSRMAAGSGVDLADELGSGIDLADELDGVPAPAEPQEPAPAVAKGGPRLMPPRPQGARRAWLLLLLLLFALAALAKDQLVVVAEEALRVVRGLTETALLDEQGARWRGSSLHLAKRLAMPRRVSVEGSRHPCHRLPL